MRSPSCAPTSSSTAPPGPTSTAPRPPSAMRCGSTTRPPGSSLRPPPPTARAVLYVSSDYVFDGTKGAAYVESDLPGAISRLRALEAGGRDVDPDRQPAPFHRPLLVAVRDRRAQLRRDDAAGRRRAGRGDRRLRPGGEPDLHAAPRRRRLPSWSTGKEYGIHHIAGAGRCSWFEYAQEIFDQAGLDTG